MAGANLRYFDRLMQQAPCDYKRAVAAHPQLEEVVKVYSIGLATHTRCIELNRRLERASFL